MWPEVNRELENMMLLAGEGEVQDVVTPAEINVIAMKMVRAFSKVLAKSRQLKLEEKRIVSVRDNLSSQVHAELIRSYNENGGKPPTKVAAESIVARRMETEINKLQEIRAQIEYLESMVQQLYAVQSGLTQMNVSNSNDVKLSGS